MQHLFHPLPLAIGLRYLRAKRRTRFVSFHTLTSIIGIALGVIILIVTIAVMNGFQTELRERILGMVAHATISGYDDAMPDWSRAVQAAEQDKRVVAAAPYVEREAWLQANESQGALLRGVLPERELRVSDLGSKLIEGRFDSLRGGDFNIVLGIELANRLGVGLGDKVTVIIADLRSTPFGSVPTLKRFTVSGIFRANIQEADFGIALIHLEDAQRLGRMGAAVTGVRLKLHDLWEAWYVARDLASQLGDYHVSDWSRDHANFFRALKMEKTVMFILLSLLIVIAAFNLVSSLVMLVQDKQSDIAILRTLGLSPNAVMQVFVVQGLVIGVVGIVLGVVGGVLLALNLGHLVKAIESLTGNELMPTDVYYISGVPTVVDPTDVAIIAVLAFVMCLLATLYPSRRAALTDPATALRYE